MENQKLVKEITESELDAISGAGFWYEAGKFIAEQFNVSDSIYKQYGNTNRNHW